MTASRVSLKVRDYKLQIRDARLKELVLKGRMSLDVVTIQPIERWLIQNITDPSEWTSFLP